MSLIIENNGIKAIELNGNGNGISNEIVSSHWQAATGQEIKFENNKKKSSEFVQQETRF